MKRLTRGIRGFFGLETEESSRDEQQLEQAAAEFRQQFARFNESLAAAAGYEELLKEQVRELEGREATLRAALDAAARAPIEPGDAADLADRWDLVKAELAARRTQLQHAEAARNDIAQSRAAAIETARQKLAQFKEALGEARIQAKLKEAIEARPLRPSP